MTIKIYKKRNVRVFFTLSTFVFNDEHYKLRVTQRWIIYFHLSTLVVN